MNFAKRTIKSSINQSINEFPVVVLSGPRQSGKTTLLKEQLAGTHRYVSIEPPDIRQAAQQDPRGFLALHQAPVIFDEIQYAPELLPYIKELVDQDRQQAGRYVLSGSQNLLLSQQVSESLAGRAAILKLLPFSKKEIQKNPDEKIFWQKKSLQTKVDTNFCLEKLWQYALRGSYPELYANKKRDVELWQSSYIQTYLERDVRQIKQVADLTLFQNFLRLLAARSGQLLDMSQLGRDVGVSTNTVKAWISVLEATFQIIILRPYFANLGKRLVKMPKIYFTDTGLLSRYLGISNAETLVNSPYLGAVMETMAVTEIYKYFLHHGLEPRLYFWRTSSGMEVDLLVEVNNELIPIEIKSSATPNIKMARQVKQLMRELPDQIKRGYVIHSGDVVLSLGDGVIALPFAEI